MFFFFSQTLNDIQETLTGNCKYFNLWVDILDISLLSVFDKYIIDICVFILLCSICNKWRISIAAGTCKSEYKLRRNMARNLIRNITSKEALKVMISGHMSDLVWQVLKKDKVFDGIGVFLYD